MGVKVLGEHAGRASRVKFSPNASYLASIGYDGCCHIYKFPEQQPFDSFGPLLQKDGPQALYDLSWHPHQAVLLVAAQEGGIRVWDVLSGSYLQKYTGHKAAVKAVDISGSGSWVASGGAIAPGEPGPEIHIWDFESHLCPQTIKGHTGEISALAWSPDSKWIASAGRDKLVQVYDIRSREVIFQHQDDEAYAAALSWSPNGRLLAAAVYSANFNQVLRVWDIETGEERHIILFPSYGETVCWDEDKLLLGTLDGQAFILDTQTRATLQLQPKDLRGLSSLDWSPATGLIATSHADGRVLLREASSLLGKKKEVA